MFIPLTFPAAENYMRCQQWNPCASYRGCIYKQLYV